MSRIIQTTWCSSVWAWILISMFGCTVEKEVLSNPRTDPTGTLHFALEGSPGDVTGVLVVVEGQGVVEEKLVSLLDMSLPPEFLEGAGSNHAFADVFFTLKPGRYIVNASPMKLVYADDCPGGTQDCAPALLPSEDCAPARPEVVQVHEGETAEVVIVSTCDMEDNGGLDIIVTFNSDPIIDDLVFEPSKFSRACEAQIVTATAEDPDGDAVTYRWELVTVPAGAVYEFAPDGNELSFLSCVEGTYEVLLTVCDTLHPRYQLCASLSFPLLVAFASDNDVDEDGVCDPCDNCVDEANRDQTDTDNDGWGDVCDNCESVANPEQIDTDGDDAGDACDPCPLDPNKINPGRCGCGTADTDTDGDGTPDCEDECPEDPDKIHPGICGCGVADTDRDGDRTYDCNCASGQPLCNDRCPDDPNKINPGRCGCGTADTDTDGDGIPDCVDNCPHVSNPNQVDSNGNGIGDACEDEPNLSFGTGDSIIHFREDDITQPDRWAKFTGTFTIPEGLSASDFRNGDDNAYGSLKLVLGTPGNPVVVFDVENFEFGQTAVGSNGRETWRTRRHAFDRPYTRFELEWRPEGTSTFEFMVGLQHQEVNVRHRPMAARLVGIVGHSENDSIEHGTGILNVEYRLCARASRRNAWCYPADLPDDYDAIPSDEDYDPMAGEAPDLPDDASNNGQ